MYECIDLRNHQPRKLFHLAFASWNPSSSAEERHLKAQCQWFGVIGLQVIGVRVRVVGPIVPLK